MSEEHVEVTIKARMSKEYADAFVASKADDALIQGYPARIISADVHAPAKIEMLTKGKLFSDMKGLANDTEIEICVQEEDGTTTFYSAKVHGLVGGVKEPYLFCIGADEVMNTGG